MESLYSTIIDKAYRAFNARDIDGVFELMDINIHWPKAFEGGHVIGQDAVRQYWTRQWSEINPTVQPISIEERSDGKVEVMVHQLVRDMDNNILFDGNVKHIYEINDQKLSKMHIE